MCNCRTDHMLCLSREDSHLFRVVSNSRFVSVGVWTVMQQSEYRSYILYGKTKGAAKMNITDVRVRKVAKEGKMKAVVSITIDDEFVVHDIKVIEGEKGLFIAMPSRKATDGEYRDIAHPINSATRDRIQRIILDKYDEVMAAEPEEAMEA